MNIADHVHRYEVMTVGRRREYLVARCTWPECTHYVPIALARGRRSVCERCGETYVIPMQVSRISVRPLCEECRKRLGGA